MIVDLDIPDGHGQVRLRLPGGWPGLAELADIADALADSASCPECGHMPASDYLRAMADVAPAHLATALRELAGPEPAPGPAPDDAGGGLAALYEKHADQLAAIEAAYKTGPSGLLR